MDKEKFDQSKYNNEYNKNHYVQLNMRIPAELKEKIDKYCADMNISKTEFLRRAIKVLDDYGDK